MTWEFIYRNNNHKLIVIFAGWSTDSSFYSHVRIPGWDTLVMHDYSDFDFPTELLEGYTTVTIFAWSLGVFAASLSFPFDKAAIAIAVNGTEQPVDNRFGIPENIYYGTSSSLNERNLLKFRRRMAGDSFDMIADRFADVSIETLRNQLNVIGDKFKEKTTTHTSRWDRVYISRKDFIFPPNAQKDFWEQHISTPQIIELDAPHYVDLLTIIKATLPHQERIGQRFKKALPTYDDTAAPQKTISNYLIKLLADKKELLNCRDHFENVLEIGPGTGFLTYGFGKFFNPHRMDFVELFENKRFNVAPEENYYVADGEKWIAEAASKEDRQYDAIISASVIQWFANPGQFFHNASILLKPGGVLLCSTFLPGNLEELLSVSPYGLVYHSAEELKKRMPTTFRYVHMEETTITACFNSPREMLAHLVKTGVGGTSTSTLPIGALLPKLPSCLTYKPLYILAVKQD